MTHGTSQADYRRHLAAGDEPCSECRAFVAARARARRHARGVTPRSAARCGTNSGYVRHIKDGSPPCQPCRDAHAAALKAWRRDRRRRIRRGSAADVILDYLETYDRPLTRPVLVEIITERHPDLAVDTIRRALARLVAADRIRYAAELYDDPAYVAV